MEEISEAAMKEYQNKERTFPGYRWEPRVTEEDEVRVMKHTEEPYIEAINMGNRTPTEDLSNTIASNGTANIPQPGTPVLANPVMRAVSTIRIKLRSIGNAP